MILFALKAAAAWAAAAVVFTVGWAIALYPGRDIRRAEDEAAWLEQRNQQRTADRRVCAELDEIWRKAEQ